jgi:hypothetical protein
MLSEMAPFIDSTGLSERPGVLHGRMARYGYLFIPGLLPTDTVRALFDAIMGICKDTGWADANGRAQIRISTDYRYQGVSQPIVADGLEPHYGRVGWSEIYQGWHNGDFQYYWRDLKLNIVARDTSFHERATVKK